jgi:tripartite-type tricarboxylate transporter receptor subunit TctC
MMGRGEWVRGAATAVVALTVGSAWAATPAESSGRPIRLLVPSAPGASNDSIARLVANGLRRGLDSPFVIDNRPGAGGIIACELVARAPADGHTLLFAYATFTTSPFLQKLPYDVQKDFAPITELATQPLLLMVNTTIPVNSVKELIALAKSKPGGLTAGYTQVGSATHLATEIFKSKADIVKDLVAVSYKGGAAVQIALMSGEVQTAFSTATAAIPQLKTGKLKVLAVSSPQRLPYLPDAPTFDEVNLRGIDMGVWQGLLAPAATPPAVVNRIYSEVVKLLKEEETKQRLAALGSDPVGSSPEEFRAKIQKELQQFGQIIKALGLKP